MSTFLDKSGWVDVFQGFEIVDVAIRSLDILQFCLRKKLPHSEANRLLDHDIPTRIVSLFLDEGPGDNVGYQQLNGMGYPVLGVSRPPFERPGGIVAGKSRDGDAWPFGGGNGPVEQIAPGEYPCTNRLKCVDGYTYSAGTCRQIYKRISVGKWVPLMNGFPTIPCETSHGFLDLDAFSETDMYAVGGHGDIWHFDGTRWRQMGFPTNEQLATVTCAGDGNVYVSSEGGSLWVGQKSTWHLLYKGSSSVLWNDVLWFNGQLWLASDYQLRVWDGKSLEPVMHNGKSVPIQGHMDAFDGLLVVASLEFAKTFDGNEWRNVVAPYLG